MKCGVEHIGSLLVYLSLWFVVFSPNFPKLSQVPKYTKTGTTWCLDDLYFWVRPHLVWILSLTPSVTFFDFIWTQFPKYNKTTTARLSNGLYTWVKHHLISKVELNNLDHLLCIFPLDLGIWAQFPQLALKLRIPLWM